MSCKLGGRKTKMNCETGVTCYSTVNPVIVMNMSNFTSINDQ